MQRLKRAAVLTRLIERLDNRGSWCGETHVQKAVYLLQDLGRVPIGFTFIMYRYGPFSFELRDDLTSMRADMLLRLKSAGPYSPRIAVTEMGRRIQGFYSLTLKRYEEPIEFIAKSVGSRNADELERIGTAFFVSRRLGDSSSVDARIAEILQLKPHIRSDDARSAVIEMSQMIDAVDAQWPC